MTHTSEKVAEEARLTRERYTETFLGRVINSLNPDVSGIIGTTPRNAVMLLVLHRDRTCVA